MSIHFGENKTKSILFSTKIKKRKTGTLRIHYCDVKTKQYSKVTYFSCKLDESLSGEATDILTLDLKRLSCNALIQPHFDYGSSAWFPKLNKKFQSKCKLSKTNVTEITLEWGTLKKLTGSRFLEDLIDIFVPNAFILF